MSPAYVSRRGRIVAAAFSVALFAASALGATAARGDASRFVRERRGVVDLESRLTWRIGDPRFLAWTAASDHCDGLDGGAGWRLPTVQELEAMIVPEASRVRPYALVPEVFGREIGAAYWSSDARTRRDTGHRLAVDEDGSIDAVLTAMPLAVRCVRPSIR